MNKMNAPVDLPGDREWNKAAFFPKGVDKENNSLFIRGYYLEGNGFYPVKGPVYRKNIPDFSFPP